VNVSTVKRSPHATDRHVGNRVRMRRKMQGMTQEKLGEALDLRLRLRLPRHVGRARADESLHADRKRQAQAIHCCFGEADRRRRRT
jgi:hypothetical protein